MATTYGFTITAAGWELLAKLIAGDTLEISRVMVGSGRLPEDINPGSLTDLVQPVAQATTTLPIVMGKQVKFTVEYRSDLYGGLETGFWLREFGVYAMDGDSEVLLYYATLGEYPQFVAAYESGSLDVRRFPVTIVLTDELNVTIAYPSMPFMTAEEVAEYCTLIVLPQMREIAEEVVGEHNLDPEAHPDIRGLITDMGGRVNQLEDIIGRGLTPDTSFRVSFEDLVGVTVNTGVWNESLRRLEF